MPDRRETMAGYVASQKIDHQGFFTIPDYRNGPAYFEHEDCAWGASFKHYHPPDNPPDVKIPGHYIVCPTCDGKGSHVNPSIDSNGITQSEMDELGEDFRESYFAGDYDIVCSECRGARVVLEANNDLTDEQAEVLKAYEDALAEEGSEIRYRNMGYQF